MKPPQSSANSLPSLVNRLGLNIRARRATRMTSRSLRWAYWSVSAVERESHLSDQG